MCGSQLHAGVDTYSIDGGGLEALGPIASAAGHETLDAYGYSLLYTMENLGISSNITNVHFHQCTTYVTEGYIET